MTEQTFTRQYDSSTRMLLERVFAHAWEQLQLREGLVSSQAHAREAREELATRIAEAYENGEREPASIEFVALNAFDRWIKPD
jgi:hypothetical protein